MAFHLIVIVVNFFNYIASLEVADKDSIPQGMVSFQVPSSLFASFRFKFDSDIERFYEVLDYIYGIWLPESKYKLSNKLDLIEVIDFSRNLQEDHSYEIWIPLEDV